MAENQPCLFVLNKIIFQSQLTQNLSIDMMENRRISDAKEQRT